MPCARRLAGCGAPRHRRCPGGGCPSGRDRVDARSSAPPPARRSGPRASDSPRTRALRETASCSARCPPPRGPGDPSSLALPEREREHERASRADDAVAPDAAAVHLDEALRQREPETCPLIQAGTELGLLELLEDSFEIAGG